jgi:hypothetical protein
VTVLPGQAHNLWTDDPEGLGVPFLVMAVGQSRKRPKKGDEPVMPKWMATIDGFNPIKSTG